jgi:hypothetical protein
VWRIISNPALAARSARLLCGYGGRLRRPWKFAFTPSASTKSLWELVRAQVSILPSDFADSNIESFCIFLVELNRYAVAP